MNDLQDDCLELKKSLLDLYKGLTRRPSQVLFRIAVEEIESWFIADREAIKQAYPKCKLDKISQNYVPDQVIGAWECLAQVLGHKERRCDLGEKKEWAEKISPHLDLNSPRSPSLRAFIDGIEERCLE